VAQTKSTMTKPATSAKPKAAPAAPVHAPHKPSPRPSGGRVAVAVPTEDMRGKKAGKPTRREDQKKLALVRVTLPEGYKPKPGEEIGLERLEARPIATLCLDAQERWEHRQRQMGD